MKKQYIAVIVAMLIFGSIGIMVRAIDMTSGQIALARGVIGSLFLLVAAVITKQLPSKTALRENWLLLLLSGAAIGANWILLFEAYRYTTVPNATISYYFAPVFVILFAPIFLKEKLTTVKVCCLVAALLGMFAIIGPDIGSRNGSADLIGIGYGLGAALLYASVVLMNQKIQSISGMALTLVSLSVASLVLLPYVLLTDGFPLPVVHSRSFLFLIIVGIVNTGIAYVLYLGNIRLMPAQTAAMLSFIDPVFALILSFAVLGEYFGPVQGIGAILVLGATIVNTRLSHGK